MICLIPLSVFTLIVPPPQPGGRWEKLVVPGVTYVQEIDPAGKAYWNMVRVNPRVARVRTELAMGNVFDRQAHGIDGRETPTQAAARTGAEVVINASFFPFGEVPSGDPLGLEIRDGEMVSHPHRGRAAFAWGDNLAQMSVPTFEGSARLPGGNYVTLQGINEKVAPEGVVINTPRAGFAMAAPKTTATFLIVRPVAGLRMEANGTTNLVVESVVKGQADVEMPKDRWVVAVGDKASDELRGLAAGDRLDATWSVKELEATAKNAVGGGPIIVRNGVNAATLEGEGFNRSFSETTHPRSAVGVMKDGTIWLVTRDGRMADAVGVSLNDLAKKMLELGCVNAMNLDGGGSTAMAVRGLVVNRPSGSAERAVCDFIVVEAGTPPTRFAGTPKISAVPTGRDLAQIEVRANGKIIPPAEIIYSAKGGWIIDQGGLARKNGDKPGVISANYGGRTVSLNLP